jgi:hypothetical protein
LPQTEFAVELHAGRQADVATALVAAHPRAGEGQQRAQALAAGRDDVAGQLRDQRHGRLHVRADHLVDRLQVVRAQPLQRRDALLGVALFGVRARRLGLGVLVRVGDHGQVPAPRPSSSGPSCLARRRFIWFGGLLYAGV